MRCTFSLALLQNARSFIYTPNASVYAFMPFAKKIVWLFLHKPIHTYICTSRLALTHLIVQMMPDSWAVAVLSTGTCKIYDELFICQDGFLIST